MKKYGKITGILLSVAVVVLSIIMSTQIPTVNPKITDLPLAIVNQDKNETTATMIEKLKERSTLNDNVSVKWIEVGSKDEAIEKMNGCILNPGHGKIPAPDFNFYIQKDKYPI